MRKMLISSAAALLCAAAVPAAAAPAGVAPASPDSNQSEAQPDRAAQQPRTRDRSRLICRTARVSETRIPQRICQTQAEWDLDRADSD